MKNFLIIIGLVFLCPNLQAQSINNSQKKQLQKVGLKNKNQFQRYLSNSDRKILKRMQNEADSVSNLKSARQRSRAIQAFNQKYTTFRSSVLRKAKFSNETNFREVASAFPNRQFKKGSQGFYSINKKVLRNRGPNIIPNTKYNMMRNQGKVSKTSSKPNKAATSFASTDVSLKFEESGFRS